jgi:hypothetical protein
VFEQDPVSFAMKREHAIKKEREDRAAGVDPNAADDDETYHSHDEDEESESSTDSITDMLETPDAKKHTNPDNHPAYTQKDRSSDANDQNDAEIGMTGPNRTQSISTNYSVTSAGSSSGANINRANTRTEHRKHRGMMQWKPIRNAVFAKDQSKIGLKKLAHRVTGSLDGRQPGVESGKTLVFTILRAMLMFIRNCSIVNECLYDMVGVAWAGNAIALEFVLAMSTRT